MNELHALSKEHKPSLIYLIETRAQTNRVESVRRKLKFKNSFVVEPQGLSGGLALLWNKEVTIQILESSPNVIHMAINEVSSRVWFDCSFVYGHPIFQQRRFLWNRLTEFHYNLDRAWCCVGEFNEVLHPHEKQGLRSVNKMGMNWFREFVNSSELMELELKGFKFTWASNPREGFVTKEKLDICLANWNWRILFPNTSATALGDLVP
jgi:hypothetical protein